MPDRIGFDKMTAGGMAHERVSAARIARADGKGWDLGQAFSSWPRSPDPGDAAKKPNLWLQQIGYKRFSTAWT
jgi:hypothetical protein